MPANHPGMLALLGSGETSPTGGGVYDLLVRRLTHPPTIALIETPAGFQPNSALVAARVADYIATRLHDKRPRLELVAARQRGTPQSPDNPAVSAGLCQADLIFLGPGSPSYAVRQLRDSLTWHRVVARQRHGAALVTASAATIALGAYALPVYEIYKVGADLHWLPGLDLLGPYGLKLAFLPHWNNSEGGADLDTSHCYMGRERYERLVSLLPPAVMVVGIDEHTVLLINLGTARAEVRGRGSVTLIRDGHERHLPRGTQLPLSAFGSFQLIDLAAGLPADVWAETAGLDPAPVPVEPAVQALIVARQAARERRDWAQADALRQELAALGWQVQDTPSGPVAKPCPLPLKP